MAMTPQQLRERLAQYPQAEAIDPDTGRVYFRSQRIGDYYVPGISTARPVGGGDPRAMPGAIHRSHTAQRWHLGLPSLGI